MNPETITEFATAVLATQRHTLTGGEIEACEWALTGDQFEDDMQIFDQEDPDEPDEPDEEPDREDYETKTAFQRDYDQWEEDMEDYKEEHRQWEAACAKLEKQRDEFTSHYKRLMSLFIQFSREIGEFIRQRDLTISRNTIETHNRLHPQAA